MIIREAKVKDVEAICALISQYAEQDQMLSRSMADIYEHLQTFTIAELDGKIIGCCSLQIVWDSLAEIKSLAVDPTNLGIGAGGGMVEKVIEKARELGVGRLFALTLKPQFFQKMGFGIVEKNSLPMKVWSDCARCTKQENCDEIAVVRLL